MPKIIDRTGEKFGRLLVLGLTGKRGNDRLCKVKCDCGVVKEVVQSKLTAKHKPIRSCGCLAKDNHYRTHNMTNHKLYPIWRAMMGRCYNSKNRAFANYGGRGIKVCDAWKNNPRLFIKWLEDNEHKKGLEIDRIDNDGNYEPENCRITTVSGNCRNRRSNIFVNYKGSKVLFIELVDVSGIKYATLYNRIFNLGMTPEHAINFGKEGLR